MRNIAVVLAAGKGTRMKSGRAKVSHLICGLSMIEWVVEAIKEADFDDIYVVCGHRAEDIQFILGDKVKYIEQKEQLGTGHAVKTAIEAISDTDIQSVLVACGDTPMIRGETLKKFLENHQKDSNVLDVMTTILSEPTGYGRIVREHDQIKEIVEEKDADEKEKQINEINVGTYLFKMSYIREYLDQLDINNAQGEFYLTDLVKIATNEGFNAGAFQVGDVAECLGVNNRLQLAKAEQLMRRRINEFHLFNGVTIIDPEQTYIGPKVSIDRDVIIEPNVIIEGECRVGESSFIGMGSKITNSIIGENCIVRHAVLSEAIVGNQVNIGPFAYLRPGTVLEDYVKIGDFVEVKNSNVEQGSKIPHLSYIGDSDIGEKANIGCGTITCNYDGQNKHRTVIGSHAFIGSNTNLVAPINIGEHSYIGAGSTLRKDVEPDHLAVSKAPLVVKKRERKQ